MISFNEAIKLMPILLRQLNNSDSMNRFEDGHQRGIYVFLEKDKPIYVGRSNDIKKRLARHCQPSSGHNKASFAFNLAKEIYEHKYGFTQNKSREILSSNSAFRELFNEQKKRVSEMKLKLVEINDPIIQTIFEVYAAIELKTLKYNNFDTH